MLSREQVNSYLFEVLREAEIVDDCRRRFEDAAERWLSAEFAPDLDGSILWQGNEAERDMLASLEGLLNAFARISLFFFPQWSSGAFSRSRGARLREVVGLDDSHPLANRDLRNHWMHLDERLDREVQDGRDVPIGYFLAAKGRSAHPDPESVLRLIDPGGKVVYVLGERYPIAELTRAVDHVRHTVALVLTDRTEPS